MTIVERPDLPAWLAPIRLKVLATAEAINALSYWRLIGGCVLLVVLGYIAWYAIALAVAIITTQIFPLPPMHAGVLFAFEFDLVAAVCVAAGFVCMTTPYYWRCLAPRAAPVVHARP